MSYETLVIEIQERVALITLNRPQALNAVPWSVDRWLRVK